MTPDSNYRTGRPLIWLAVGLGVVCVALSALYTIGNLGPRILSFRVNQVFWMGLFCIGAGLLLARVLRTATSPFRGAGWLLLGIGAFGIVLTLAYRLLNIGDSFLTFDLGEIFTMGLIYAAIGAILLLAAGRLWKERQPAEPIIMETLRIERPPMATPTKPKTATRPISDEFANAATKGTGQTTSAKSTLSTGWRGIGDSRPVLQVQAAEPAGAWQATESDDLRLIGSIDTPLQNQLNVMGINTFEGLAAADGETLAQMVVEAGFPDLAHEAEGWPHLARFAADGNVQAYRVYSDVLAKGRSMTPEAMVAMARQPDDLSILEGVGPKIQDALNAAGITTFTQVATLTPEELEHIVKVEAGVRMVGSADTWPKQARYVVEGDLRGFQEYLKQLIGGREKAE